MKQLFILLLSTLSINLFAVTVADPGPSVTFCAETTVYVQGSAPAVGEVAYWIDLTGLIQSPGDTIHGSDFEQEFAEIGTYNFKYHITDGIDTSSAFLVVEVIGLPDIENSVFEVENDCAGQQVEAIVKGVENVDTYNWSAISGASLEGGSGDSAIFLLADDLSSQAEISVVASNECGVAEPIFESLQISQKPLESPVIAGDGVVCENKEYTYFTNNTLDASSYKWDWNGLDMGSGDSVVLNFGILPSTTSGDLKCTPINLCGIGESSTLGITIQLTDVFEVELISSSEGNEFCAEEEDVTFTASPKYSGMNYTFSVSGLGEVRAVSESNIYYAPKGSLTNGSVVTVEAIAGEEACFINQAGSASLTMKGYDRPTPVLSSTKNAICESEGSITLTTTVGSTDSVVAWVHDLDTIVGINTSELILSSPSDRGAYEVVVGNKFCEAQSVTEISVVIYEQPDIQVLDFLTTANTLVLEFDEQGNDISEVYEVLVDGLDLDLDDSDSYTWSSSELTINEGSNFDFIAKKGVSDSVYLVVNNGVGEAVCKDSISFYVKDADAVGLRDIVYTSNAIYPNPLKQGGRLYLDEELHGALVEVYTLEGVSVYSGKTETMIPLGNISSGVYIIKMRINEQLRVSQLVIE